MLRRIKKVLNRETSREEFADPELLDNIARDYGDADATSRLRLEEQFSLALHNTRMAEVFKRTNPRRLPATEEAILGGVLSEYRANCRILDMGASDGITSVELLEHLQAHWGTGVSVVTSDLNLWLVRYRLGPLVEYREPGGDQMLIRIGGWGFRTVKLNSVQTSEQVKHHYLRTIGKPLYWQIWSLIGPRMRYAGRISLINPRAKMCRGLEARVLNCLIRDSSLIEEFHCVRASNVLNIEYFTRDELVVAVSTIHAYLKEGGCLVISRNEGVPGKETEHGTAWIKTGRQFASGRNFGGGSEIKELVDSFRAR